MVVISKLEADFFYSRHFTLRSILKIYTYPIFPQLLKRKTYLSKGRTKWNLSIDNETLDTSSPVHAHNGTANCTVGHDWEALLLLGKMHLMIIL